MGKAYFYLVLKYSFFVATLAQFPRRCVDVESLSHRECCPLGKDGSKCGQLFKRGFCKKIQLNSSNLKVEEASFFLFDDRAWWPRAFYDFACSCYGNFDGIDCSSCKYGFEGFNCDQTSPVKIRKNITNLTSDQLRDFVDIVKKSKNITSENYVILTTSYDRILQNEVPKFANASIYDVFVWMHYYVTKDNYILTRNTTNRLLNSVSSITSENRMQIAKELLQRDEILQLSSDVDYAHEGPAFLLWHRYFMLKWESEIRQYVAMNPNFTLPYWDWQDQAACEVCNDPMFGGQHPTNRTLLSERSPFSEWNSICTKGNLYMKEGLQCTGDEEGPVLRNPGNFDPNQISGLPTSIQVNNMLQLKTSYDEPNFDKTANMSFRNILEGFANPDHGFADDELSFLHNAVHLYMNGTMSSVDTSANDPIFLVHHVFVDSLFEIWLQKFDIGQRLFMFSSSGNKPRLGHRVEDLMVPFFPLVPNALGFTSAKELGYTYDYFNEENLFDFNLNEPKFSELILGVSDGSGNDNIKDSNINEIEEQIALSDFLRDQNTTSSTDKQMAFGIVKNSAIRTFPRRTKFKKFRNRKKHFYKQTRYGEGSFIKYFTIKNNPTKKLGEQGEGSDNLEDEQDSSSRSSWENLKQGFYDFDQIFRSMSNSETAWLVVGCLLLIGCLISCFCICRSTANRYYKHNCCCCQCRHYEDEEEYYALLDTSSKISSGNKSK